MSASAHDPAALERDVRRVLDEIKDPCSVAQSVPMGLDEMGLVGAVEIDAQGHVTIALRLSSPVCEMVGYMRTEATARVRELPGVASVSVRQDSGLDWTPDLIAPAAQARRRSRLDQLRVIHQGTAAR